jgi:hypothetical protein
LRPRFGSPCCAVILRSVPSLLRAGPFDLMVVACRTRGPSPCSGRVGTHDRPFGACSQVTRVTVTFRCGSTCSNLFSGGFSHGDYSPHLLHSFRAVPSIPRTRPEPVGLTAPFTAPLTRHTTFQDPTSTDGPDYRSTSPTAIARATSFANKAAKCLTFSSPLMRVSTTTLPCRNIKSRSKRRLTGASR